MKISSLFSALPFLTLAAALTVAPACGDEERSGDDMGDSWDDEDDDAADDNADAEDDAAEDDSWGDDGEGDDGEGDDGSDAPECQAFSDCPVIVCSCPDGDWETQSCVAGTCATSDNCADAPHNICD